MGLDHQSILNHLVESANIYVSNVGECTSQCGAVLLSRWGLLYRCLKETMYRTVYPNMRYISARKKIIDPTQKLSGRPRK